MKKIISCKKVIAMCLVMILCFTVIGCGNTESSNNGNNTNSQSTDKNAAKQNVYAYEEVDFGRDMSQVNLQNFFSIGDVAYAVLSEYIYNEEMGTSENKIFVIPIDKDGKVLPSINLERENVVQNSWLNAMIGTDDGFLYAIYEEYADVQTSGDDNMAISVGGSNSQLKFVSWDTTGTNRWEINLSEVLKEESYFYISKMFADSNNNVNLLISGDKFFILSYDSTGNLLGRKEVDQKVFQNGNIFKKTDGSFFVTSYDESYTKQFASTYDIETGILGEPVELFSGISSYSLLQGTTSDLILSNTSALYTYNIGDSEPKILMDFVNSDLNTSYLNNVIVLDDKKIIANYYDAVDYNSVVSMFTYVDPSDIPDKDVITLGCVYLNGDVRSKIIDFNKSNDAYRITVKDYSTYNTSEDYSLGQTQLNNDIIGGQIPDLLVIDTSMPIDSYVSKGLFTDISELIKADEELSKIEYIKNVFDAFSVDGKLYQVIPSFNVQTMIAKKSLVGEKTGWTMAEFNQFMATMPEEMSGFGSIARDSFMYTVMNYVGRNYIDVNTGKCNFNTPEFIELLEYAKTLPESFDQEYWNNYDYTTYESQYRENKTLLQGLYMSDFSSILYSIKGMMGEEVSFIGFPSPDSDGHIISSSNSAIAISSKSSNQEGAWKFAREFLTEEFQKSNNIYGFSVIKSIFEEKAKEATKRPTYEDENGNQVEYDNVYYINNEEVILEPFTQDELNNMMEMVYRIDKTTYYNQNIINIINEEAAAFFSGQKSAADVAAIIQSRAQIYVDENN